MANNIRVIKLVRNSQAGADPSPVPAGETSGTPVPATVHEIRPDANPKKSTEGRAASRQMTEDLKKKLVFGFLACVGVLVVSLIYRWYIFGASHISTDNAYIEADIWPVNSRNLGSIREVLVKENQRVKKGDSLIRLDDSDVQIELRYKSAKFNKAQADVQRLRQLGQSKMVSPADLETAEATLVAMKADYDGALLKEEFTHINAQSDGIVTKVNVHPGQFIQPGQNLILIVSDDHLWIKANYKETDLRRVKLGNDVEIEVDAFPGEKFEGKVESIYPVSGANLSLIPPENATGNFTKIVQRIPVKISLQNERKFPLRPGMSALTTIIVKE